MKKLVGALILIIILSISLYGWWGSRLDPVGAGEEKSFIITKGENLSEIAADLEKQGLIRSASAFKLYAKQSGLDQKMQAGTFKVASAKSSKEIALMLTNQPNEDWVTLLEGWRVEEMAEVLNKKLKIQSSKFIEKSKEGYMFPDTYLIPKDYNVDQIVALLRNNFEEKYSKELRAKIRAQGLSEEQGVILASIVEREARSDEVRTKVAGILLKRFKINMGLNVDATIQYALGYRSNEKSWWKRSLSLDDLKINSKYNTYIHAGLPPTPICNPSLSSLRAVANADSSTPYLYYYHDSKGNSYYAKTLDEHNENVANNP